MKNIEVVGALVVTCLLTACGINTPELPRTPTALLPPSPVPEHVIPPPTYARLPDTATPTHIPPTATIYETPRPTHTPLPSNTPTPPLPAWCVNRLPARKANPDEAGKINTAAFGTSFFEYMQRAIRADADVAHLVRNFRFSWFVYSGEDTALLRTHLPEMAQKFQMLTDQGNYVWNHIGAIRMINNPSDADAAVEEADQIGDEEAACFPGIHIIYTGPVPIKRDSSPQAQIIFTKKLKAREESKGRPVIDEVGPLTYGNPPRIYTELLDPGEDLHYSPLGYRLRILPSILPYFPGSDQ